MHRRSEVVQETRQSQRQGARRAAGLWLGFEDLNLQAGLRQNDGRRQTVGTCANDNGSSLALQA